MEGEIDLDNSTSNLNNLAVTVLKQYSINADDIRIIQGENIKAVWKLKYNSKYYCLKRLKQTLDKVLFSVNAQIYINGKNGKVPSVILNINNSPITSFDNQLFVLYEWVEGRDLNFKNASDFKEALRGIANFHNVSRGYIPPCEARVSSKFGKWMDQYNSMKNKFLKWKELSYTTPSLPHYNAYIKSVDSIIDIANRAIELLKKSKWEKIKSLESEYAVLCHQDYGRGNALLNSEGIYIIDLDGVTFDLCTRDLRKIIGKESENKRKWDISFINTSLGWYEEVNPIKNEEKEIFIIDLLYPHWFYGLVKNIFINNKTIKASEIEGIARFEQSKVSSLMQML